MPGEAVDLYIKRASEEDKNEMEKNLLVCARATPDNKMNFVSFLKRHGHKIAVVADATCDASALAEADVGITHGATATQVAKQASDAILIYDNIVFLA